MRVRPRFSVDGCGHNSRLLGVFKSLDVEDLTHVIIHLSESAGLPLSPSLFFGLHVNSYLTWRDEIFDRDSPSWRDSEFVSDGIER